MEIIKYSSFFIPPAIAILIFVYLKYKFQKGHFDFKLLLKSFIWGMFSIVLVLLVQLLAAYYEMDSLQNLRRIIFYSLAITALFSELGKFFFLKVVCYPKQSMRGPVEGIIYSVMIAMGFATMNNILYFINIPDLTVNTVNIVTSGPANVIFGLIMGFFVGLGKFRKIRFIDSMTGLLAAIFFHALYSFCMLTEDYKLLAAFFIGSAIIVVSLSIVAIRMNEEVNMESQKK